MSIIRHPLALPAGFLLQERYRLGQTLGSGGFAITYVAWDDITQKQIAVKEFFPRGLVWRAEDKKTVTVAVHNIEMFAVGVAKFRAEAKQITELARIPNIINVFDCFMDNGTVYYTMEYLKGQDLRHFVSNCGGLLQTAEVLDISCQTASALDFVHKQGLIHRDVKPENIFVCSDGLVKLLDFGAAQNIYVGNITDSECLATKKYAPWEQYTPNGQQGPWTDIYALGATMYFMLKGVDPPEALDVWRSGIDMTGISDEIAVIITKAMQYKIDKRWQSAVEMLAALQKIVKKTPPPADFSEFCCRGKMFKSMFWLIGILTFALLLGIVWLQASELTSGAIVQETTKLQSSDEIGKEIRAGISASEPVESGNCGPEASWIYYNNGTLIISGKGNIYNYYKYFENIDYEREFSSTESVYEYSPWTDFRHKITNVIIEEGIKHLGAFSFYHCFDLEHLILPDSLVCIAESACCQCSELQTVNLPEGLTEIGMNAFIGCRQLQTISLPDSLSVLGQSVFEGCDSLQGVIIPHNVKVISQSAFQGCGELQKAELSYGVEIIEDWAFNACALTEVKLPESLISIGNLAFTGCELTEVVIPSSVREIGVQAFALLPLTTITIPEGVERIETNAFVKCHELTKTVLPASLKYIGEDAFAECSSLQKVVMPDSIVEVVGAAFDWNPLIQKQIYSQSD